MSRSWPSNPIELVQGRGEDCWPRPGPIFAAGRTHTFGQLATAIDDAFARGNAPTCTSSGWPTAPGSADPTSQKTSTTTCSTSAGSPLGRLKPAEQFAYEFDFGDSWTHLCTIATRRIDPLETLGIILSFPLPY
jgi:hypothetical protein